MHCTDLYSIPEMILGITIFQREVLGFLYLYNEQQIETPMYVVQSVCTLHGQGKYFSCVEPAGLVCQSLHKGQVLELLFKIL